MKRLTRDEARRIAVNVVIVGERQSGEHKCDRLRSFPGRHDIGRNDRAEAEEGAMGKCGHDPRAQEQRIAWRDRAQAIPENKDSNQQQQCPTAIETGGGDREDGPPNATPSA
jgi:hypothetical protein